MNIVKGYSCRFLKLWVFWFWAPALDVLGLIIDTFVPSFSPPRWLYWAILALGFVVGNVKLFAEQESEKQSLQNRIDEFEDTRANILLKNIKNLCYPVSINSPYFSTEGKTFHDSGYLLRDGLPIGLIIGAELKVANRSNEPGDFDWWITEIDMSEFFNLLESGESSFQWGARGGEILDKVTGFIGESRAICNLPIKITVEDPRSFAQRLSSLGSYRIVIEYRTIRIDSESKTHSLTLEGDFQEFCNEICKRWKNWFSELAQLAECQ